MDTREETVIRKEMKSEGRRVLKKHYLLLVFLVLIVVLFGTEFSGLMSSWKTDLARLTGGEESAMFGRTNGVFAQLANTFSSGKMSVMIVSSIRSITHSDRLSTAIYVLGALIWFALIYIFVKNVLSAVFRRIFLEARVYEKVSLLDMTYFLQVKKWINASLVMIWKDFCYFFWCLTVVGAFVKYYSYWAVPYIVAENPSASAKETLTLSRMMMNGHKMELFRFQLSMLGWYLLSIITFGISDLVYGLPYRLACYSEFYVRIRKMAIESGIEGPDFFNDRYLYEKADRVLLYETYFDVIDEITEIHEKKIVPGKFQKFMADTFGVWLGSMREKRAYDEQEGRRSAIAQYQQCMKGEAYPFRLNPLYTGEKGRKKGYFSAIRSYPVWVLILLFILFCFIGWSWEVALHMIQTGQFANRGTLHGPWLPIYGTGGIVVLIFCSRFRWNPMLEFFTAMLLCGILEYTSALYLETRYHQKWWSYEGYFLNLHGRICAEGLLVFGVGCCVIVYLVAPVFDYMLSKVRTSVLIGLSAVLFAAYWADYAYSTVHPNMAKGAIEEEAVSETEVRQAPEPEEGS